MNLETGRQLVFFEIYASLFFRTVSNNAFVSFQKNIIRNDISY